MVRNSTIVCIAAWLLIAAVGCRPTAPSIANGPPNVTWRHLTTENWRYELQDPKRIANYSFNANGRVLWTDGTKQGDLHSVAALGGQWYIDDAGDLIISDESHSEAYRTLALVTLTAITATVVDSGTGLTETYSRRFTP